MSAPNTKEKFDDECKVYLERFSEEISEMGGEILALDEAEGTGNIRSDLSRARQRSQAAKDPDPFRKFVLRTALTGLTPPVLKRARSYTVLDTVHHYRFDHAPRTPGLVKRDPVS